MRQAWPPSAVGGAAVRQCGGSWVDAIIVDVGRHAGMVLLPSLTPPLASRRQPRLIRASGQRLIGNIVTGSTQSAGVFGCFELGGGVCKSTVTTTMVATFVLAFVPSRQGGGGLEGTGSGRCLIEVHAMLLCGEGRDCAALQQQVLIQVNPGQSNVDDATLARTQ